MNLPCIPAVLLCLLVATGNTSASTPYENQVLSAIENARHADVDTSLANLADIVDRYPNSKIGHLLMADLLALRSGGGATKSYGGNPSQLNGLRDEIRHRWKHAYLDTPALTGLVPENLVIPPPNQPFSLVVDASQARLYVYDHSADIPKLVDHYYVTVGKHGMGKLLEGDLRTPVGVYHVTSFIPGEGLPDRYGPGAFPINYPNQFDRMQNRTGYGIWIHGTESENYNRVPWASDGCVSMSNDAFLDISQYIDAENSTPVIISEKISWVTPAELTARRTELTDLLMTWKADWESLDHEAYIRHYSPTEFSSGPHTFASWDADKRQKNQVKDFIDVNINALSITLYPEDAEMMMMSFDQEYQSSNYSSTVPKTLLWKRSEAGAWQIIFES